MEIKLNRYQRKFLETIYLNKELEDCTLVICAKKGMILFKKGLFKTLHKFITDEPQYLINDLQFLHRLGLISIHNKNIYKSRGGQDYMDRHYETPEEFVKTLPLESTIIK